MSLVWEGEKRGEEGLGEPVKGSERRVRNTPGTDTSSGKPERRVKGLRIRGFLLSTVFRGVW